MTASPRGPVFLGVEGVALTATDRPYKKAIRVEEALDILREEQAAGSLDATLLDLFIEARIFDRTDWR